MTQETHTIAKLAREAIERYVRDAVVIQPDAAIPELQQRAGVFVSIHKNGELRGCIGTFQPTCENVAEEVVSNAISAATRDPRFEPVTVDELDELDYKVDILSPPEPVEDVSELDPQRYGVIVESGWRRGLLLPALEGVDSVQQQIEICRMKAGIGRDEPVRLHRFEVTRYQ